MYEYWNSYSICKVLHLFSQELVSVKVVMFWAAPEEDSTNTESCPVYNAVIICTW